MTTSNDPNGKGRMPQDDFQVLEVLIGRIIDGEATSNDVAQFIKQSSGDEDVTRLVAERARDKALINQAFSDDIAKAEQVELPVRLPAIKKITPVMQVFRIAGSISGWAAAAILAIVIGFIGPNTQSNTVRTIDFEKMRPHIIQEEQGIELPPIVTQTNELDEGLFDITIIERKLHRFITDEFDPRWIRLKKPGQIDKEIPVQDDTSGSGL